MEQKMWLETAVCPRCLEPSCLIPAARAGLGAAVGSAGEDRASSSLWLLGCERRCRGGSPALLSGTVELELWCCCVSLVLSLLLSSRSGIGFVSAPGLSGACSACRGVLLCHCHSLRIGRELLCRSPLCLSPRCSFPEQFWCLKQQLPSASSLVPFKFCCHPEVPQAWSCQARSAAQETLESLGQELRTLCTIWPFLYKGKV